MRNRLLFSMFTFPIMALMALPSATAWEHHPLLTRPILETMAEVDGADEAEAVSLDAFLVATEAGLAVLLAEEEAWARANLPWYAPRPDALAFQATGNPADIRDRFFLAIRINPNTKTPLYVSPLAENSSTAKGQLDPSEVTLLQNTSNLSVFKFETVDAGELVDPVDIVAAASNEPDYGMDVGLFEDNNTDFGHLYGFGVQPFGNPALDYGSQAPFHMGFYHESPLVFFFASFLEQSYPEHRIHLFKSLSEFAFEHGQEYWGWRFMGWGLHYLGDLSMPYHTTALPGYSTFRMLLINLLDMLGWSTFKDDAMQLSSNRHMALEIFQGIVLAEASRDDETQDPSIAALLQSRTIPPYTDALPRAQLAKASYCLSRKTDAAIGKLMPARFVSDPSVELADCPDRYQIVEMIEAEHGTDAIAKLSQLQAQAMTAFAVYGRSYVQAILNP